MSGPQFIRPQSTVLSGLGEMMESHYKLQPKQVYRCTLADLACLAGEIAIDSAVKDTAKSTAGMCVSQR